MGWIFSTVMQALTHVFKESIETSDPVLIEVITERFRGHSISDPGLYRTKESLKQYDTRSYYHSEKALIEENNPG